MSSVEGPINRNGSANHDMASMKDTLFLDPGRRTGSFDFDEAVAEVFDDMLERSVPFYLEIQSMIADLVDRLAPDRGLIYDLGCSTGTTLALIDGRLRERRFELVGVDSSPSMLVRADEHLRKLAVRNYHLHEHDLNVPFPMQRADAVIMNLVLQFIRPENRGRLVGHVNKCLSDKGCLLLVEKVAVEDETTEQVFTECYHAFKKRNLYSDMEIARKREALENTLIPYTVEQNIELLSDCGFERVEIFFKWFNFCGFVATKG